MSFNPSMPLPPRVRVHLATDIWQLLVDDHNGSVHDENAQKGRDRHGLVGVVGHGALPCDEPTADAVGADELAGPYPTVRS